LEIEAHLTASVTVPGEVRGLIRRLRGDLSATVYDSARLLASEVATNAVLYGAPGAIIHFHAELYDDCLRIQIRNERGIGRPVVAAGEREHGGGWGLPGGRDSLSPPPTPGTGGVAGDGGGWADQAAQQKLNAQLTRAWCRRMAMSERTWKSALAERRRITAVICHGE